MKKRIMSLALCMAMVMSLSVSAFAGNVDAASKTGETTVTVSADGANFDVTVPTKIAIHVGSTGEVTCSDADALKIVNNSAASVMVSKIEMKDGAWSLVDYNGGDRSAIASKVDEKKLGFALTANGDTAATAGVSSGNPMKQTLTHTAAKWTIEAAGNLPITPAAIATTVSTAIEADNAETAATVVFTIGWAA